MVFTLYNCTKTIVRTKNTHGSECFRGSTLLPHGVTQPRSSFKNLYNGRNPAKPTDLLSGKTLFAGRSFSVGSSGVVFAYPYAGNLPALP